MKLLLLPLLLASLVAQAAAPKAGATSTPKASAATPAAKPGAAATPALPSGPSTPASPAPPAPQQAKSRLFDGMGRTPEEEKTLEEFSRSIERYEAESKEFRKEVQLLVEKKFEEKRSALANSYEKAIRDLEIV